MKFGQLWEMFANPPVSHRGIPFWSWNDDLQAEQLNRQVYSFKDQGMGGFMMHARQGLETPYLEDTYMDLIKSTVRTAREAGVEAWLYDEERYSSGMGGGLVAKLGGDTTRAKALIQLVETVYTKNDWDVAVYQAELEGQSVISYTRIRLDAEIPPLPAGSVYLVYRRDVAKPSEWCHDDTYPDNLNPESARIFIETTYERYKEAVGDEFGKTVPGIFTDEPSIRGYYALFTRYAYAWVAWTDRFPAYFKEKNEYDLLDDLPCLFYKGARSHRIRLDYWRTITELFSESYIQQISKWCSQNKLQFTGHFHSEGDLVGAVRHAGAVMPHYRYFDIPGIDILTEQTNESLTIKQAASVARQFGKRRLISETYGVTGWGFTFEGRKWLTDWQLVLGVNLFTHHLAWYSWKGMRKRDYPPSFNEHTNWWKYNHVPEAYCARLSTVLAQGEEVCDVLVLHPCTTIWSLLGAEGEWGNQSGMTRELYQVQAQFQHFVKLLLALQFDYDLGDELIIRDSGRAEEGVFTVGQANYSVVVLPPLLNLLDSTVKLLKSHLDAGGKVLAVKPFPLLVNGEQSMEVEVLFRHPGLRFCDSIEEVPALLEELSPRSVRIKGRFGQEHEAFLHTVRDMSDCRLTFIVNNDREASHEVTIELADAEAIEEWNPLTGERREREVRRANGRLSFTQRFGPADARLFISRKAAVGGRPELASLPTHKQYVTALGPICTFTRTEPNALVLDRGRYRIGNGEWSEEMDVWQAQKQVREVLGMRQVDHNGTLSRYHWVHEPHERDGTEVSLLFQFHVSEVPFGEVYAAIEQADRFQLTLNGESVVDRPSGYFWDHCVSKVKLPRLRLGDNEIVLTCAYDHRLEMEDIFLIGDFAVSRERSIEKESSRIRFGDWCLQGYPHYCGSLVYHLKLDLAKPERGRIVMELGEYRAVTMDVKVNGYHAGHLPWRATHPLDITDWLNADGSGNSIDIEVVGSPRNLLGPLHQRNTRNKWSDCNSFRRTGSASTSEYVLEPFGLFGQIHIDKLE